MLRRFTPNASRTTARTREPEPGLSRPRPSPKRQHSVPFRGGLHTSATHERTYRVKHYAKLHTAEGEYEIVVREMNLISMATLKVSEPY